MNMPVMEHGPEISCSRPAHELLRIADEMLESAESGRSYGLLMRLTRREWRVLLDSSTIGGRPLELARPEHLRAVRARLRIDQLRDELKARWERQMASAEAPAVGDLGDRPEETCRQFVKPIRTCLDWHESAWLPLEAEFHRMGFNWTAHLESTPPGTGDNGQLRRLRQAVLGELGAILGARSGLLRLRELQGLLACWQGCLPAVPDGEAIATNRLRQTLAASSANEYRISYEELVRLRSLEPELHRRNELLSTLTRTTPAWASAIRNRVQGHDTSCTPGDPHMAWEWRQLHDELERRAAVSLEQLQQRIETLSAELLRVTGDLVEKDTWLRLGQSVRPEQRQALGAYAQLRRRISQTGRGLRDAEFRAAARR